MRLLAVCVFLACASLATAGQPVSVEGMQGLGDTRHHVVDRGDGQQYHLLVRVPDDYDESADLAYPTVYILDGGALFPLLTAYYRYLRNGGETPPLILVGVSYGTSDWQQGNNRSHDYTAPSEEREYYGGAAAFQAFLADEILPLVETNYRSLPSRRVIFGQSLGGQFVHYTAQTRADLFWGHISSNAALHRNLELFLTLRPEKPESPTNLFIADASNDDPQFLQPRREWIAHWSSQATTPWRLEVATLDGHTHFSVPPASFRAGIAWLFADDLPQN